MSMRQITLWLRAKWKLTRFWAKKMFELRTTGVGSSNVSIFSILTPLYFRFTLLALGQQHNSHTNQTFKVHEDDLPWREASGRSRKALQDTYKSTPAMQAWWQRQDISKGSNKLFMVGNVPSPGLYMINSPCANHAKGYRKSSFHVSLRSAQLVKFAVEGYVLGPQALKNA